MRSLARDRRSGGRRRLARVTDRKPILAFDAGSPRASAAVAIAGRVLAQRDEARGAGQADLLRAIDAVLEDARLAPRDLGGVLSLAGPGSFTGVRVGCAIARALSQAWSLPAGGVSTLVALAAAAPTSWQEVTAVVDALRGEWFLQPFGAAGEGGPRQALEAPRLWRPGDSPPLGDRPLLGFGAARLREASRGSAIALEPRCLAAAVAGAASAVDEWCGDEALLSHPLHLRPPSTTRPRSST